MATALDKLESFYSQYDRIKLEYSNCYNHVFNVKQYMFPVRNRVTQSQILLNECYDNFISKMDDLFDSDIRYNKYKLPTTSSRRWPIVNDTVIKEIVDALSTKYSNKLIDNNGFIKEDCKNFNTLHSLTFNEIDANYRYNYIKEMRKREIENPRIYKLSCINEELMMSPVLYDINKYPTHDEYIKCTEDREKMIC
jgi:hypothetical protein